MKIKYISFIVSLSWTTVIIAQDPVVYTTFASTQILQEDSLLIVSTFGEPFGGIYEQDGLIIDFEPIPFLMFKGGPSASRDLPSITDLRVYPNPVSEIAILERDETRDRYLITLFASDGNMVYKSSWDPGAGSLHLLLEQYARGVFILTVTDAEMTKASHFKIVKQ